MNVGDFFWNRIVPVTAALTIIALVGDIWWLKVMLLPIAIAVIVWTIHLVVEA